MSVRREIFVSGLFAILVSTLGVNHAFAYEITYEVWGSPLKNNPTVCAIQPSFDDLEKWELELFLILTLQILI